MSHLDADRTGYIPQLVLAEACAEHLHGYLVANQLDDLNFAASPISYSSEVRLLKEAATQQLGQLPAT